jgi:hypothetical protein
MSPSGLCRVLSVLVRFSRQISPVTGDIVLTSLSSLHGATSHERCTVDEQIALLRLQKALWPAHIGLLRKSLRKQRYPQHSTDLAIALP